MTKAAPGFPGAALIDTSAVVPLLRQQAFALGALAGKLPCAANGFSLLASLLLRRLFVMRAEFHFPEDAFALHFLLERAEGLIDVIVADDDLH